MDVESEFLGETEISSMIYQKDIMPLEQYQNTNPI